MKSSNSYHFFVPLITFNPQPGFRRPSPSSGRSVTKAMVVGWQLLKVQKNGKNSNFSFYLARCVTVWASTIPRSAYGEINWGLTVYISCAKIKQRLRSHAFKKYFVERHSFLNGPKCLGPCFTCHTQGGGGVFGALRLSGHERVRGIGTSTGHKTI